MKKKEIYVGKVIDLDFPNNAKVKVEGEEELAYLKDVLPEQVVRFSVKKKRKGKVEGHLLEVEEKASYEIEPKCIHFGKCGGCAYQNLSYENQLNIKENMVKKLLDKAVGEGQYEWEGIVPSPITSSYRNKMEFTFGDEIKDGPLSLGMHKKNSFYDIVTVDGCQIIDEDFRLILRETLDFFANRNIPYYHRMRHDGFLRHLLVRKGIKSGEILIDIVTTSALDNINSLMKDYSCYMEKINYKGHLKGILHTTNDNLADTVKNEGTEILFGEDFFYEEILGLKFKITPFSFFQTNSLGAEVLYNKARDYIGDTKGKVVFDLYSGTGTIAQIVAPVANEVIGVEIVPEAVEAAKENAKLNKLDNCRFIAGDVLKVIDEVNEKPDIVILDPPREGVHYKALEKITGYGTNHIVYISCKPTSLARDLEILEGRGYKLTKACSVDLFPWTTGIETVALLTKNL